jgi:hypothetical protein
MSQIPFEKPEGVPADNWEQTRNQTWKQQERYTLTRFIDEQSKTISALGIFTALTVFSINLPQKQTAGSLTHPLFAAALLIWLELIGNAPHLKKADFRLVLFIFSLLTAMLGLTLYWLLAFRAINIGSLFLIPSLLSFVWAIESLSAARVAKSLNILWSDSDEEATRLAEEAERSKRRATIIFMGLLGIYCGLYYLAQPHLSLWLDNLAKAYFTSSRY